MSKGGSRRGAGRPADPIKQALSALPPRKRGRPSRAEAAARAQLEAAVLANLAGGAEPSAVVEAAQQQVAAEAAAVAAAVSAAAESLAASTARRDVEAAATAARAQAERDAEVEAHKQARADADAAVEALASATAAAHYTPEMPEGVDALTYFETLMRDPRVSADRRDKAAREVLAITHAKASATKKGKKEEQADRAAELSNGGSRFGRTRAPLRAVGGPGSTP